jgi:hypothetical protein
VADVSSQRFAVSVVPRPLSRCSAKTMPMSLMTARIGEDPDHVGAALISRTVPGL